MLKAVRISQATFLGMPVDGYIHLGYMAGMMAAPGLALPMPISGPSTAYQEQPASALKCSNGLFHGRGQSTPSLELSATSARNSPSGSLGLPHGQGQLGNAPGALEQNGPGDSGVYPIRSEEHMSTSPVTLQHAGPGAAVPVGTNDSQGDVDREAECSDASAAMFSCEDAYLPVAGCHRGGPHFILFAFILVLISIVFMEDKHTRISFKSVLHAAAAMLCSPCLWKISSQETQAT